MNIIWNDLFLATPDHDEGFQRNTGEYIEQFKAAMQERIGAEHNFAPTDADPQTDHGAHKTGSALTYYGAIAPSYRPDGVTALSASDAGRMWIDDNTIMHIWNGTAWIEISAVPAIGSIYMQFSKHNDPNTLYPGTTWTNVSSSYAGNFFRSEGGAAAGWDVQQATANLAHTHAIGVPALEQSDGYTGSRTSFARLDVTKSTISQSPAGSSESRPPNKSVRLWYRSA